MSISDIGCDILEIKRFKKAFKRRAKPLLDRLFTKTEQEYCLKFKDPTPHLAARFSAKEAVAKALGTGFGKKLSFLDIEIINDKNGKPTVLLSKKVQNQFSGSKLLVSISHSKEYVMAVAIKEPSQTKST